MATRKLIPQIFHGLLIVIFLLTNVSTVQAELVTSPLFASGDFLWAKSMGGAGYDYSQDIAIDSSGNVYTTGTFEGTVDFDPGAGIYELTSITTGDIFVSKLDNSGNFVWAKNVGVSNRYATSSLSVDTSGNVYITGDFESTADLDPGAGTYTLTSAGGTDIFVSKLDTNGIFVWARSMGGTGKDTSSSISIDTSRNVYITGSFNSTADFDPSAGIYILTSSGNNYSFISKLDINGNFVWAKSVDGTGFDYGQDIALDASNNIYTTGTFGGTVDFDPGAGTANLTSVGSNDIFITKLDNGGNFVWAKSMGGKNYGSIHGEGIAIDSSGNIYTTGRFSGTADFDPGVGTFNLSGIFVFTDIFVSKLDSSGNFVWAKRMGGAGFDGGSDIAVDSSGNVYTTGTFERDNLMPSSDFDPGPDMFFLTSAGSGDIFVSKLDSSGNFVWAKRMGGTSSDGGRGITIDSSGNIYTTGYFQSTADFDPSAGTSNLISEGNVDVFVSKFENGDVSPIVSSSILASANPAFTSSVDFTVAFSESVTGVDVSDFSLTITGISGANVAEVSGSGSIYTVTVNTGSGNGHIRLNIVDDDTIQDTTFNPLGGTGAGNGNYISGEIYTIIQSETFADVPLNYWASSYVERLFNAGILSGCETGIYCPDSNVTRSQAAVLLLKGIHSASYTSPIVGANTAFNDVATNYWAAAWIKQLAAEGITSGCGAGLYCPDSTITRAQMAILLLKSKHGPLYSPPPAAGIFTDVPVGYWADKWIEQLAVEGITSGCGADIYCPDINVTRAQMAVFLVKAFNLP